MIRVLILILAWAGLDAVISADPTSPDEIRRFSAMHAVVELTIPADNGSEMPPSSLADMAEAIIRKADRLLSPRGEVSDVRRLNQAGAGTWIEIDPDTMRVVEAAIRWHTLTGGTFDPTIGPLKRLFKFNGKILEAWPTEEDLAEAGLRVGAGMLRVDRSGCRLAFARDGMNLDLGAIAKGFAADKAAEALKEAGVKSAIVNVGGEMRVLGSRPGNPPLAWRIGVTDPRGQGLRLFMEITDRAVATSGDYESYFEYEGRRYSHIIDPLTGQPLTERVAGVTVSHPTSATDADALATVMSLLGVKKGFSFLREKAIEAGLAGVEILLFEVDPEGKVTVTRLSVAKDGGVTATTL